MREFRPPTRFSRASADATLALDRLSERQLGPAAAAAAVRTDLLDTYDGRLRSALDVVHAATVSGFDVRRAEAASAAAGYWRIVRPTYVAQRGPAAAARTDALVAGLVREANAGAAPRSLVRLQGALEGFRAAPLSDAEQLRRAGQLLRFTELVPIEYGRGVRDGRVVLDFEIQEAITFRDGAAAAFADLESILLRRDPAATRQLKASLATLGDDLAAATRGDRVATPDAVRATAQDALRLAGSVFPERWNEAAKTADFDVIAATLDRVQAAAAQGDWGRAEQARLEAYGVFELGPEQRLRGIAPGTFQKVETLFWYGNGDADGLVQLIKRKATLAELEQTRLALDEALAEAEARVGAGAGSRVSVITNSAIIVFREGLEAVLILAALMASMVGAQRGLRRPLMLGVVVALAASVVTWVVAQTVLGSLAGWGEKLEAVVSLVAIAVLLLILNWFYHRVYWQENLSRPAQAEEAHPRGRVDRRSSRRRRSGSSRSASRASTARASRRCSSSRRCRSRRVPWTVLQGVAVGFAGVLAVFGLVIALERRLPHKKMLIATGVLITGVLAVLVGTHGADDAGRRLGAGHARRGPHAAVLGGDVVRPLPDVGGPRGTGRGGRLRRRQLPRRRGGAAAEACADPGRAGHADRCGRHGAGRPLAADLPGQVRELRLEELLPRERDGLRGAGHRDEHRAAVRARRRAREHRRRADLLPAQHPEELAEAGEGLLEQARERVVRRVALGDAGPSVDDDDLRAPHEVVHRGADLVRLVADDVVAGDDRSGRGDALLEPRAVRVGLARSRVADRDHADRHRAALLRGGAMCVGSHRARSYG